MSSVETNATDLVHTYRVKPWVFISPVFSLILMVLLLVSVIAAFIMLLREPSNGPFAGGPLGTLLTCFFGPLLLIMLLPVLQMILTPFSLWFSRIKITPEGITENYWPYRHIHSAWKEVDRIGKVFLFVDVLFVNDYQVLGPSLGLKTPFNLFRPSQRYISLSGYQGWPKGQLEEDILKFAPGAFVQKRPASSAESTTSEAGAGERQERLWAAIAHGAILMQFAGLVVTFVIWLTQKEKSALVRFQALQALIWQALTALLWLFLTGGLVLGALLPIFSGNGVAKGIAGSSFATFVFVGMALVVWVTTAFSIYGIIGALKTYQGQDFRYFLIGKLIKRKSF